MIIINTADNNLQERKYILDIFFKEFLGLKYEINFIQDTDYNNKWSIVLGNGRQLLFNDSFFSKFQNDKEYLVLENLPQEIEYQGKNTNCFLSEVDLPIIYGNSDLHVSKDSIFCGIDIFASSFFMLTRWEEYVNKTRDIHNRFILNESIAEKNNFFQRPVVDEYLEMLKKMLLKLDDSLVFKERIFQLYLTHDIDTLLKKYDYINWIQEIGGDFVKRKKMIKALNNLKDFILVCLNLKKDPYDTFDYLMDLSEQKKTKSYFFFMSDGSSKYDGRYSLKNRNLRRIIANIEKRNHEIGYHSSYNSFTDLKQFMKEKDDLEKEFGVKVNCGRNHYLRFEVPATWQIWEDAEMKWDSTCYFTPKAGFRCGVCQEYSVFNIVSREHLKLKEKPLIVMDVSFNFADVTLQEQEIETRILELYNRVKKYKGDFVFLWHNSSFNNAIWEKHNNLYESLLRKFN